MLQKEETRFSYRKKLFDNNKTITSKRGVKMYALSYNKFKPQNTIIQVVTSQYDNLLEGLSRVETVCNNKQIYKKEAE